MILEPTDEMGLVHKYVMGDATLTVQPYDPHGFWKVTTNKGRLPDFLSGQYTSVIEADKDVQKYVASKKVL